MRYSDILLMYAEAMIGGVTGDAPNYTGSKTALEILNLVRQRAGLSAKAQCELADIQEERAKEFAGEHIRKYDLMRWGLLKEKLEKAQADVYDLQNNTGDYAGRPDSVWYHFKRDDSYAQAGAAFVFDKFVGLDLDAVCPAEYSKEDGWVAKSFFTDKEAPYITPVKWYLYKEGTNIDMHQYWPIFDVNVSASNGTLWNDYEY
jgi:hypothetical protein